MWKTIPCLYELMIFTWVNVEQFALHLWIFIYLKIYEFKDIKLIILVFTGSTIHLDCYKLKSLELIRVAKNKWRWRNLISWHMVGIHHTRTFLTKEVYNCFTPFPMWKTSYEISLIYTPSFGSWCTKEHKQMWSYVKRYVCAPFTYINMAIVFSC